MKLLLTTILVLILALTACSENIGGEAARMVDDTQTLALDTTNIKTVPTKTTPSLTSATATWTECVSLKETTCAEVCGDRGMECSSVCTTSRDYAGWAVEAWRSSSSCNSGTVGAGQVTSCTYTDSQTLDDARHKCCCVGQPTVELSDLEITSVSWYPQFPKVNEDVSIKLSIENKNLLAPVASTLVLIQGDGPNYLENVILSSAQTARVTYTRRFTSQGAFSFLATVDANNTIAESNENNNIANWTMVVNDSASYCGDGVIQRPNSLGQFEDCDDRLPQCRNCVAYGTPGGWEGCRGSGIRVCDEQLVDPDAYFAEHEQCTRSTSCGYYLSCNENYCPPEEIVPPINDSNSSYYNSLCGASSNMCVQGIGGQILSTIEDGAFDNLMGLDIKVDDIFISNIAANTLSASIYADTLYELFLTQEDGVVWVSVDGSEFGIQVLGGNTDVRSINLRVMNETNSTATKSLVAGDSRTMASLDVWVENVLISNVGTPLMGAIIKIGHPQEYLVSQLEGPVQINTPAGPYDVELVGGTADEVILQITPKGVNLCESDAQCQGAHFIGNPELVDYPDFFMGSDDSFNVQIITPSVDALRYAGLGSSIKKDLARYGDVSNVVTIMDSRVNYNSPRPSIVLGSTCINTFTQFMSGNPEDCTEGMIPGFGRIHLTRWDMEPVVVVSGWDNFDLTSLATSVLLHANEYLTQGINDFCIWSSGNQSNTSVRVIPCPDTAEIGSVLLTEKGLSGELPYVKFEARMNYYPPFETEIPTSDYRGFYEIFIKVFSDEWTTPRLMSFSRNRFYDYFQYPRTQELIIGTYNGYPYGPDMVAGEEYRVEVYYQEYPWGDYDYNSFFIDEFEFTAPTPFTGNASCFDNDGGANYAQSGTVTITQPDGLSIVIADYCLDTHSVREGMCNATEFAGEVHYCERGCSAGACLVSSDVGGVLLNGIENLNFKDSIHDAQWGVSYLDLVEDTPEQAYALADGEIDFENGAYAELNQMLIVPNGRVEFYQDDRYDELPTFFIDFTHALTDPVFEWEIDFDRNVDLTQAFERFDMLGDNYFSPGIATNGDLLLYRADWDIIVEKDEPTSININGVTYTIEVIGYDDAINAIIRVSSPTRTQTVHMSESSSEIVAGLNVYCENVFINNIGEDTVAVSMKLGLDQFRIPAEAANTQNQRVDLEVNGEEIQGYQVLVQGTSMQSVDSISFFANVQDIEFGVEQLEPGQLVREPLFGFGLHFDIHDANIPLVSLISRTGEYYNIDFVNTQGDHYSVEFVRPDENGNVALDELVLNQRTVIEGNQFIVHIPYIDNPVSQVFEVTDVDVATQRVTLKDLSSGSSEQYVTEDVVGHLRIVAFTDIGIIFDQEIDSVITLQGGATMMLNVTESNALIMLRENYQNLDEQRGSDSYIHILPDPFVGLALYSGPWSYGVIETDDNFDYLFALSEYGSMTIADINNDGSVLYFYYPDEELRFDAWITPPGFNPYPEPIILPFEKVIEQKIMTI